MGAFDPARASIGELRAALDARRVSAESLVRHYFARIERNDRAGPRIHALIAQNPRALDEARALDVAGPHPAHGCLRGIPFVVKDNIDTAGLATTGGSVALQSSVPAANAAVVQALLDQGAVLIGKANLSELAASHGRLGYSSIGGLTVNPYNPRRDASGSSSGSAAAVAADFAAFALGTDTSGSLRGPASVTGLVGLRPTLGWIDRRGVMPVSPSLDTVGALTRSVADQAIVLRALTGATLEPAAAGRGGLRGARLGAILNFRGANAEIDAIEEAAMRRFAALGAVLVPLRLPREFETLRESVIDPLTSAEFKSAFEGYLGTLPPGQPRTLAQLIARYESPLRPPQGPANPRGVAALKEADAGHAFDPAAADRIRSHVVPDLRRRLVALLTEHRLQAFVFATMSCPAAPRFDRPDPSYACAAADPYQACYLASAAGFPEVTIPMGCVRAGPPVGCSFLGLPGREASLLALAAAAELEPPLPPPRR